MALSIREKKLAVLWLAEQAVVRRLVEDLCPQHMSQIDERQKRLTKQALAEFSLQEKAELQVIDAQIPKV